MRPSPDRAFRSLPSSHAALAPVLLALAGACGSPEQDGERPRTSSGPYGRPAAPRPVDASARTAPETAAALDATEDPELGTYLVDVEGRALYLFRADAGGKSTCSGACAEVWPPLTTLDAPWIVEGKLRPDLAGTVAREDGALQVTYGGWPLYRYAQDAAPGDTHGHGVTGFGAEWMLVTPDGTSLPKR